MINKLTSTGLGELVYTVVDAQTTGTSPRTGHLIEFALQEFNPKPEKVVSRFIRLPKDEELPGRITSITGITAEDLESGVELAQLAKDFQTRMTISPVVICHYARFERPFVVDFLSHHTKFDDSQIQWVCTYDLAKLIFPDLPTFTLRAVSGYLGLSIGERKRAVGHIEATQFIWENLRRHLIEKFSISNLSDLDQWIPERKKEIKVLYKKTGMAKHSVHISKTARLGLPDAPGVYEFYGANGRLLYVGKAKSLKARVNSYFVGDLKRLGRKRELVVQIHDLKYRAVQSPLESALVEFSKIKTAHPPYNVSLKQSNKSLTIFNGEFLTEDCESGEFELEKPGHFGLFRDGRRLHQLNMIVEALVNKTYDEDLFYGFVSEIVIGDAFSLLIEEFPQLETISNGRSLMTFCLFLLRNFALEEDVEDKDVEVDEIEILEDDLEDDPEDVKEALFSMMLSMARSYLRQKFLIKLLNCEVQFTDENGSDSILTVRGRNFAFQHEDRDGEFESNLKKSFNYEDIEFARVLSTEIFRVYEAECNIKISLKNKFKNMTQKNTQLNLDFWWTYLRN